MATRLECIATHSFQKAPSHIPRAPRDMNNGCQNMERMLMRKKDVLRYSRIMRPNGFGSRKETSFMYENVTSVPASIDWKKGAVTSVKNQGNCGSCWTFSTVAATEGIHAIAKGILISLSEQELVSCDTSGEDQGCEGGLMEDGFEFIVKNHGINSDKNYPYDAIDGTCNKKKEAVHVAQISGYQNVPADSESALLKAVANQPVSVSIDASGADFQFYSSGVFTGECRTDLDHGVTAVGYGTTQVMVQGIGW
ncbi:hypothetical protein Pint_02397 [Pistacia integerrima]|uniref:Uncharacterized protein n=1 Tax=Pistacia integerrima TaxID=434235 RepID=A0ACC0ZKY7_9ROSI|nr:hypothetical protein Pint_02397 [Pistacia integerrima]